MKNVKEKNKIAEKFENKIKTKFQVLKNNLPTFREDKSKEIYTLKLKEKPSDNFLDRKKIIIFSLMGIFAIILIALTVTFITDINVKSILTTINEVKNHTGLIIVFWIFLFILISFIRLIWQVEAIRMRMKHYFVTVKVREWWNFGLITVFINTVTIFSLGSDPYKIWWMTRRGIKLREANAILLSSGWIIQITQMIISYPSLGYIIYLYFFDSKNFIHTYDTNVSMILLCVGYCNDIIVFISISILGFNKRLQYLIAKIFNWIRKKIGLSFKSKVVLLEELVEKNKFQEIFKNELKSFEANTYTIFWTFVTLIFYYFSMFFAYELVVPYDRSEQIHVLYSKLWSTYDFANVATVANNFIPIPGSEGTIQFVLISFFNSASIKLDNSSNDLHMIIKQTVFIWRVFNYYLIIIVGALYLICLGVVKYIRNKIKKHRRKLTSWFEIIK